MISIHSSYPDKVQAKQSLCSPFHRPYRHCTFTVCCPVFTFPLSLSSLYLHSLLLGVHISTVLIVTVLSQFVARCSHFHCPHQSVYLPCLSVVQCSPFHCPHQSVYRHSLLLNVHLSAVFITVPSLSVV